LPYSQLLPQDILIKYGGKCDESEELKNRLRRDIVLMKKTVASIPCGHGGGPPDRDFAQPPGISKASLS